MKIPEDILLGDETECDNTIKVIITKRPTLFGPLELPRIGQAVEEKKVGDKRGNGHETIDGSEDWETWTFPFSIIRK